jgi:Na+-driven multidrug efflux pump
MLGNMVFKKHKAGKTFASYLGISYVLSTIFGLAFTSSNSRLKQWLENMDSVSEEEMIQIAHNGMICGMVVGLIITAVLLYFTYRKIKTQKY